MSNINTEKLILSSLIKNNDYTTHVISFIKDEYFNNKIERELFNQIKKYIRTYNNLPNKSVLKIDSQNNSNLNELELNESITIIDEICSYDEPADIKWLVQQTEDFCKLRAVYIAITKAISIYDGTDLKSNPNSIPDMMKDAISISFDTHVGMDFIEDAEERFNYYTADESKIKFDIDILNKITNGGITRRTLNMILAFVNSGKTTFLCHLASSYLKSGLDVLYVSLEMRSEEIGRRIDSNLLDVSINEIQNLGKENFLSKINSLKTRTNGRLKIKEYAPSSISSIHIRSLLAELDLKQNFKPTVIIVDYLALLLSDKMSQSNNSHFYLKSVAEELRAIAVDYDLLMFTAGQLTRSGGQNTDSELTDIAESIGIANTIDLGLLLSRTEELDQIGQVFMKQLKNRYGSKTENLRFNIGADFDKQRFFDNPDYKKEETMATEFVKTDTKSKFSGLKV